MVDHPNWPAHWNTDEAFSGPGNDGDAGDKLEAIFTPDERGWNTAQAFASLGELALPGQVTKEQQDDLSKESA
ncbi:MAG TPA: hypothetical protein VG604_05000 [Candidatus Saccharimonadales bacterium]|nr:hypothetical protein [Candidatus Saccharimonadales bacterium]